MIQKQTIVKINDNSGIKIGQCIHIYKKPYGNIGDYILLSIKKLQSKQISKTKLKKGNLFKAIITQTKYKKKNTIGNLIQFDGNNVIILNPQQKCLGTRIIGPITSIFRQSKQFKILSLASNIL